MNKITPILPFIFNKHQITINTPLLCKHRLLAASYSTTMKGKKIILQKIFEGAPKETDVKLVEEELPPLKEGGKFLVLLLLE